VRVRGPRELVASVTLWKQKKKSCWTVSSAIVWQEVFCVFFPFFYLRQLRFSFRRQYAPDCLKLQCIEIVWRLKVFIFVFLHSKFISYLVLCMVGSGSLHMTTREHK
jgi:hypothetical protein